MRKVWKWLGAVCLALVLAACNDSDWDGPITPTIDLVVDYEPWLDCNYPIDSNGYCPVAAERDFAGAMKRSVIGHGWIHDFTSEIDEEGRCDRKNYYEDLDGASPRHFYVDSEEELTVFLYIDARPAVGFYTTDYRYGEEQNSVWIQPEALDREELRLFQIVDIDEEWNRLVLLTHLGQRGDRQIYGLSIYHRATPDELAQLRKDYPDDLSELD